MRVLWGALLLSASPALGLSEPFSLSGYLIDGLTNQPLPGIRVHLYEWASYDSWPLGSHGPATTPVVSDSEGRFIFARLAASDYVLQAELPHEVYTYSESVDPTHRHTIHVGPETEAQNILFRIMPRAKINGTVRGEHGEIANYATVGIYRRDRHGGRIELMYAGYAGPDDRGQFTIPDLWPGDYVICAEPRENWEGNFVPSSQSEVEYHPGGETRVYTESCYSDPKSQSTLLRISSGTERKLDLTLGSAPSVTLRTNVGAALYRADPPRLAPRSTSDDSGSMNDGWRIRNVTPGEYVLYALTGDGSGYRGDPGTVVRKPITVASQPLAIELHPEQRGRIDVRLKGSDGSALNDDAAAVWFYRFVNLTSTDRYGLTGLSHSFDPGDYWLSIRPKPPFCAVSQTLTGGTSVNGKVTVTPGMSARLDVQLGTNCGAIDVRTITNGDPSPSPISCCW
jgi:hypothetical protein